MDENLWSSTVTDQPRVFQEGRKYYRSVDVLFSYVFGRTKSINMENVPFLLI